MSIAIAEQKKTYARLCRGVRRIYDAEEVDYSFCESIFIIAGVGAFNLNYIKEKIYPKTEKPVVKSSIQNFIMTESAAEIDLNKIGGKNLANALADIIKGAGIKLNSIQNIYITESGGNTEKGERNKNMIEAKKVCIADEFQNAKLASPVFDA